jgi:hypothetical protein
MKGDDQTFSQLKAKNWKTNVAFLVDIMGHSNYLNIILGENKNFFHESRAVVKSFQMKMLLFSKQKVKLFRYRHADTKGERKYKLSHS